jgi:hypothetical protein
MLSEKRGGYRLIGSIKVGLNLFFEAQDPKKLNLRNGENILCVSREVAV